MTDHSSLRAAAVAATPGNWSLSVCNSGEACWCRIVNSDALSDKFSDDCMIPSGSIAKAEAEYLVAAQPKVILQLLDDLDALKAERDRPIPLGLKKVLVPIEDYNRVEAERDRLRVAIETVLADEETGAGGWGPDVTMAAILRAALAENGGGHD